MIAAYVEGEVQRQNRLLEARHVLRERGVSAVEGEARDLSELLAETASQVLRRALQDGGAILGLRLPGFQGLLADRLGPELAAQARVAGAGGVLHSDELPAYGITEEEVEAIASALGCGSEDAFAMVADAPPRAEEAIQRVQDRARTALQGVPEETRDAKPDGTTTYSRPLPGSARMYPETDVPPIRVSPGWLDDLAGELPEPPAARVERLTEAFGVHRQQVQQLVDEGWDDLFEELAQRYGNAGVVARTFLNHFPELRAEGLDVDGVRKATLVALFDHLAEGRFAKEAIPAVLAETLRAGVSVEEAAERLGLTRMGREELEAAVDALLEEHEELLRERGEGALKPLMGLAMAELRGRAEGQLVNEVLRARLRARLEG